MKAPRRSLKQWGGFVHMLARFYMNYAAAVLKAAKRKGHKRAIDVDTQHSKQGTAWALHWATLGKNKLHDPKGQYGKNTRIDHLTDAEISRMRGPKGQKPQRLLAILRMCFEHHVRAEVELKATPDREYLARLMARPVVKALIKRGDLQFKTLAWMGDPIARLAPVHDAGGTTVLSFTDYTKHRGKGINRTRAWPVVDYVRGRPTWAA